MIYILDYFLSVTTVKTTLTTKKTSKTTTEKMETTMKSETAETKTVMLTTESLINVDSTYERTTEVVEDEETTKVVSLNPETSTQPFR